MAVTLRTVVGKFLNKQIVRVDFIPTADVTIDGTDTITANLPLVSADVDPTTGTFTATGLPPTSGTGIVPTGWTYRVEVNSVQSRGPLRVFEVQIDPYTGSGTAPVLQLASLAPVASPGEIALYLTEEAADQRYALKSEIPDLDDVDLSGYATNDQLTTATTGLLKATDLTAATDLVKASDLTAATDLVNTTALTTALGPYAKTSVIAARQDLADLAARVAALEAASGNSSAQRPTRPSTTAQPSFWLRGDQIAASGSTITAWADSANGVAYAVPSGRALPTYSATAVKGKPGAVFTKAAMSGLYYPKSTKPENQTFFIVFSIAALAATDLLQATDSAGAAVNLAAQMGLGGAYGTVTRVIGNTGANAFSGTTLSAAGAAIGRFSYDSGSGVGTSSAKGLATSLNGGTVGTASTQAFTATAAATGLTLAAATGADVSIAEVIVFDTNLSAADKVTWNQYLATTYGVTIGSN